VTSPGSIGTTPFRATTCRTPGLRCDRRRHCGRFKTLWRWRPP